MCFSSDQAHEFHERLQRHRQASGTAIKLPTIDVRKAKATKEAKAAKRVRRARKATPLTKRLQGATTLLLRGEQVLTMLRKHQLHRAELFLSKAREDDSSCGGRRVVIVAAGTGVWDALPARACGTRCRRRRWTAFATSSGSLRCRRCRSSWRTCRCRRSSSTCRWTGRRSW